eukprot:3064443-Pyramimonas_sp.AAC.1
MEEGASATQMASTASASDRCRYDTSRLCLFAARGNQSQCTLSRGNQSQCTLSRGNQSQCTLSRGNQS